MTQTNIMVDDETLGVAPGCAIISQAAVRFSWDRNHPIHLDERNQLYQVISLADNSFRGFSTDPDTVRWWKSQSIWPELSRQMQGSKITVPQALNALEDFVAASGPSPRVWANSPSFDLEITREAARMCGMRLSIGHRQEADYRTIMELVYPDRSTRPSRSANAITCGGAHHALGDAVAQVEALIEARERLMGPRHAPDAGGDPGHHMMLSVKTVGLGANSGIVSIGACLFDPTGRTRPELDPDNQLYTVLNTVDTAAKGFTSDKDTLSWWRRQPIWSQLSAEARASKVSLDDALSAIREFIAERRPDKIWSNSPTFHLKVLREACAARSIDLGVEFRQELDYRTLMDVVFPDRALRPTPPATGFQAHHALGDALRQSVELVHILPTLNIDLDALASPKQFPASANRP